MAQHNVYEIFEGLDPGESVGTDGNRMHQACTIGDLKEVKRILAIESFDPNIRDMFGMTALAVAAYNGSASCVRALLSDSRVNPDLLDRTGRTSLILAAEVGYLNCVKALRKASVLDHEESLNNANALQMAALNGQTDVVKYLSRYIDPREPDSKGETTLFFAAESGSLPCLRSLMPLGDPQALDSDGSTLLMRATANGQIKALMELLPLSSLDAKNRDGKDALALAKQSLKTGKSENPKDVEATVNFLTAYKHSLSEMAALSKLKFKPEHASPRARHASRI